MKQIIENSRILVTGGAVVSIKNQQMTQWAGSFLLQKQLVQISED